jgi:hypothetical protein
MHSCCQKVARLNHETQYFNPTITFFQVYFGKSPTINFKKEFWYICPGITVAEHLLMDKIAKSRFNCRVEEKPITSFQLLTYLVDSILNLLFLLLNFSLI